MRHKTGDILVFNQKNVTDSHFKNFEFGKQYIIKDCQSVFDDGDYGQHLVYFFEDQTWGCLEVYIDKYFTTLDSFRNNKIKRIIND
jgi:hypothetical protein